MATFCEKEFKICHEICYKPLILWFEDPVLSIFFKRDPQNESRDGQQKMVIGLEDITYQENAGS